VYSLTETSPHRIIGEEIIDETDRYQDNQSKKAAKRQGTAAVMRELLRGSDHSDARLVLIITFHYH
jgi:hypothetical protein